MQQAGFSVHLDPQSRIIHHEGAGSGVRTRRVRRRHIVAFHGAALQWFALHHGLGRLHPVRLAAAVALWSRAAVLVAIDALKPEHTATAAQLEAGRPEGGAAI